MRIRILRLRLLGEVRIIANRSIDESIETSKGDLVPVLVDHLECAQYIECIIDSSLHVLEVQFL